MLDRRGLLKIGGATAFAALFGGCERLPIELRCRAHDAVSIEETCFDESYL